MKPMRRLFVAALALLSSDASAQVLHERVNVGSFHCADGLCSTEAGVKAIEQDGQVLFAPASGAEPRPGEQVFTPQPLAPVEVGGSGGGSGGDHPPDRRDVIRSDRETGPEGPEMRFYHAVFNPEIYPFKRMTALDAVKIKPCPDGRPDCDDEALVVFDRDLQLLPVVTRREPGRDAFWGSIVVDLEPERWVPIPSVAADTRILDYKTEPRIELQFARDGADNVFVRSSTGGRHRLTWLSDAPQRYFAGELPRARLSDEPAALLRPVPGPLRARVAKVLAHAGIKVKRSMQLADVLNPLVDYFRAFEVGELPPPSGSMYLDLAMAQRGVCRHRSFAFAITAMAVGIPVRYVENEVHVFVEVYLPGQGWRRINLGGAPLNEEMVGGEGKSLYQAKGGDPFPKPEAFTRGGGPPVKGLEKLAKNDTSNAAYSDGSDGNGGGDGKGHGGHGGSGDGKNPDGKNYDGKNHDGKNPDGKNHDGKNPDGKNYDGKNSDGSDGADGKNGRADSGPPRAATALTVELNAQSSFRGESVEVSGTLTSANADAANLPIEIFLDGPGGAVRVAETVTTADGRYRAVVEIPRDLPLGDHRVFARTRGDERRAPSRSK